MYSAFVSAFAVPPARRVVAAMEEAMKARKVLVRVIVLVSAVESMISGVGASHIPQSGENNVVCDPSIGSPLGEEVTVIERSWKRCIWTSGSERHGGGRAE